MSVFKTIFQGYIKGKHPSEDDTRKALTAILSGDSDDGQIGAFLMGLEMVGVTASDIRIGAELMRANMTAVSIPGSIVDTVGTGGDGLSTYNISTAAAFVCAGAGARVAKHGSRAVSSKSGSSDVLTALGVGLDIPPGRAAMCVEDCGVGFLFAPKHHSAMRHVTAARASLGIRSLFNLLGPMSNPAGAKRQLIGVFDKKWAKPMAEALRDLGSEHVWIVCGSDGLDEITTTGKTFVTELKDGKIKAFTIKPEDFGIPVANIEDLRGGNSEVNAEAVMALLNGREGAYRDIVVLNAAATLLVAGVASDMEDGIVRAKKSIDDGAAYKALAALIRNTH